MNKRGAGIAVASVAVLSSCGSGTPATVADVEQLMRNEFSEDDFTVSWVGIEPAGEAGDFKVVVDREKANDLKSQQTLLCNVSATSVSHSRTCQTAVPSIMNQAAQMLVDQYEGRQLDVRHYELRRTGTGNTFAGYFLIADPASGEQLQVPCTGDHEGTRFDINCEQSSSGG